MDLTAFDPATANLEEMGFMCGLEIHRQLDTGKLHSRQPSILWDYPLEEIPKDWCQVERRLVAASGDAGFVDISARFEAERNRTFRYIVSPNAGLIELDESPPDPLDENAIDVASLIACMLNAKPTSTLRTMRKTVIDGSNTSGFQRTTLLASDGHLVVDDIHVGIDVILLEEDSARHPPGHRPEGGLAIYTLDRLGIPLIEIATAPDIQSPHHAQAVAAELGAILVDTRRVRRGLGTIRQDLNVSIACGDRVEIKGCQDLDQIPVIIENEILRQFGMHAYANELRHRHDMDPLPPSRADDDVDLETTTHEILTTAIPLDIVDVTTAWSTSEHEIIQRARKSGHAFLGIILPGFAGLLGNKGDSIAGRPSPRLGMELAGAARLAGVNGMIQSDELPGYGLDAAGLDGLKAMMRAGPKDACCIILAEDWQARLALEAVVTRARQAFSRLPREVRAVEPDMSTRPMRPLPTGARMYPETDLPDIRLDPVRWARIRSNIPLRSSERVHSLTGEYGISEDQAQQIVRRQIDEIFIQGVEGTLDGCPPLPGKAWATMLLDTTRAEIAEGVKIAEEAVPWSLLAISLHAREGGLVTRDGMVESAQGLWQTPSSPPLSFDERVEIFSMKALEAGFVPAGGDALDAAVQEAVQEMTPLILERGMGAMGPLMGAVMNRLGGAADGRAVSETLRKAIGDMTAQ